MRGPKKKESPRQIPPSNQNLTGSERTPQAETKRLAETGNDDIVTVTFIVRRLPDGAPLKTHEDFQRAPFAPHTHLSSQEFENAYGATQADLDQVGRFCRSHGLTVLQSNRSRRSVIARGTAAQMNAAFGVTLNNYQSSLGVYHGYEGQVRLPANLVGIVEAVLGLDNRPIPSHHLSADPTPTVPLVPQQVAQLYNFPAGTGAGQTIGIYEGPGAGYTQNDLQLTMSAFGGGLTVPTPKDFPPGSNSGFSDPETILDITVSSTIAQQASIVVYFNTGSSSMDIINTLGTMIHPTGSDPVPTILSISYAWSADDDDTSFLLPTDYTQIDKLFSDAAQKGITVCIASGDTGAECESPTQAQVWFPGSDTWVLSCGGTTVGNISGSSFDEYVWNDTWTTNGGGSGATGGGVSAQFPVPAWQNSVAVPKRNVTATAGRGTPDVAGNASPNSGYPNYTGGISNTPIGGTSAVAPLYAGLVALLNQNLGQKVGFLNPIIYALGSSVCRDVPSPPGAGPANDDFDGVTGYPAGVGWDACTGWGSIDGAALLSNLQSLYQKSMTFIMQRSTFGQDEVANTTGGVFAQAFFITVDGLAPSDFPSGGITTLSPNQTQLNAWAPSVPSPVGPAGPTNITITPTGVSSDDPSLSPEVQLFTFTYSVTFPDLTAFTSPPASDFPEVLTLTATLSASAGVSPATAEIELIIAADPFFSSESNGGLYWLSEDIRVFYAEQGSTKFGAPALGSTPAAAQSFIQWIVNNISGPQGAGPNGDTFEGLPTTEAGAAISLLPSATNPPHNAIFNFALARVRLRGESEIAKKVRVFFRLFQSQSVNVPYQTPLNASGVSAPTGAYRQWSDDVADGQKIPLLGISSDGSEYITVPCFAAQRVANTSASNNMTTQQDADNVQTMTPVTGQTVYTYFGCWLDNNQSQAIFPYSPGANPDGPFSGTLYTVSQVLDRGGHQCIIAQIVDDEAPIINNATPGTSDKIAQRNLAFTIVANPGLINSRLATHTFEIRPSPFTLNADERPDELMIDWGNLPAGSTASIYLPAVQATQVLDLATRMYTVNTLSYADAHTIESKTGGITYIPIPQGSGPNCAGLFSIQLPPGIKRGQQFNIVVRQITSSFENRWANQVLARVLPRERLVYGAFQISIPVSVKSEMLVPEERTLSVLRWIQQSIPTASRWYPVFLRYIDQLAGIVTALGGDGASVPPTQNGIWPGLLGFGSGPAKGHEECYTGKVDGIVYDHFGDFEAFILETFDGDRRRFESREGPVLRLVQDAWRHRILITVKAHRHHGERPIEIVLHGAPPPFEE